MPTGSEFAAIPAVGSELERAESVCSPLAAPGWILADADTWTPSPIPSDHLPAFLSIELISVLVGRGDWRVASRRLRNRSGHSAR